ncbi:MAG: peptidase family protein, partial [Caulobacteraceae bacterium]|nr:peptidase family protein [Caulobacteraceae bacterium]
MPLIRSLLLGLAVLLVCASPAAAARFSLIGLRDGAPVIAVQGPLVAGDERTFDSFTSGLTRGEVRFDAAAGGDLLAAMTVGQFIRARGLATALPGGVRCTQACALAWLAGVGRAMAPDAAVQMPAFIAPDADMDTVAMTS